MKIRRRLIALGVLLLAMVSPVAAHRVDEYLQATLIAMHKDAMTADLFLTPGTAVMPGVIALIDTNGDGVVSEAEQRAYALRVLGDLTITVDGKRVTPQLVAVQFPAMAEMKDGMGDIHLEFKVELAREGASAGEKRTLRLENRHQSGIAVYQVNCLVPRDPGIRLGAERRDFLQAVYEVEFWIRKVDGKTES